MLELHQHVEDVSNLRLQPLHQCHTCEVNECAVTSIALEKAIIDLNNDLASSENKEQPKSSTQSHPPIPNLVNTQTTKADRMDNNCKPAERFHLEIDFVMCTKFSYEDEEGCIVTSLDGYNRYLLIVDRATQFCVFF
jgi:hypothetical protein